MPNQQRPIMKIVIASLLFLLSASSFAQPFVYVIDEFEITMRSGQGAEHKILKTLATGTKLEVVETDSANGYSLVRTEGGAEGWVLSRYLIDQPIAKDRLLSAQGKIKRLEKQLDDEKQQSGSLQKQNADLQQQLSHLQKQHSNAANELAEIKRVSSDVIGLHSENTELKTQTLNMQREIHSLKQENINLSDQAGQRWFLIGASLLIAGILVGMLGPRIARPKKSWGGL